MGNLHVPAKLAAIQAATQAHGFAMASDELTGSLLRTLAATKPGGRVLELGTGTGLATAWLLDGMDDEAELWTLDHDAAVVAIAEAHLAHDPRVSFYTMDGNVFLQSLVEEQHRFDLIFADTAGQILVVGRNIIAAESGRIVCD
ncbi:MAG: methyltransferase domain-containing protein [Blastocatellia bacterium]